MINSVYEWNTLIKYMFQYEILDITESVVGSVEPWNFASQ
jgi:hypothetical protein